MVLFEFDKELGINSDTLMEDIGRVHVDSSNIKSIWFEEGKVPGIGILFVEFLSDSVYEYHRVPEWVAELFIQAPSKGRFLWANIRGRYPYRRVK